MSRKLLLSFLTLITYVNSAKMKYMDIIEKFQTLEFLNRFQNPNTTLCEIHFNEYANAFKSEQYWALKMFDSSAKIPYSLLKGNRKIFGNYDECLEVEHPHHLFTGQYCTLNVNVSFDVEENSLSKDLINKLENVSIEYGICVPSTCTTKDIISILNNSTSDKLSGLPITLDEENCESKNSIRKLRLIDGIAIVILIGFGIVAFFSTFYDIYQRFFLKNAKPHQLLTSFSVYSNGKNLFQITEDSEHMKVLDGMRALSTYWIVLIHSRKSREVPSINLFDEISARRDTDHLVLNVGKIAVDTFFFLSGMLVCTVFFRNIRRKGYYDVPVQYIHRYIRLTPSYAAMILITVSILTYMGDGPLWHSTYQSQIKACEENWWGGISYLSTLFNPSRTCLGHTWYISTDMQLYWLSPLILFPLFFWPSYATPFLVILILAATCTTFSIAYFNNLSAAPSLAPPGSGQLNIDYVKFYTRSSPYLIGLATGYIITQIQAKNISIKLNKISIFAGWLMAKVLFLSVMYGIVPFQISQRSDLESSLYLSLHRVAWSLGLAWIVFACLNGYGGLISKFLSWNFFQPLSKLSYNVYIVHKTIQLYRVGSARTNDYAGNSETVFSFLGEVVMSNLIAVLLTLIFEMPFGVLDSYFFRNVKILPFPKRKKNYDGKELALPNTSIQESGVENAYERF